MAVKSSCLGQYLSVSRSSGTTLQAISLELYIESDVETREIPYTKVFEG